MTSRILLAALTAAATLAVSIAPAHAARQVERDVTGDLVDYSDISQGAPGERTGDAIRFTTDHTRRVVRLTTTFAELPASDLSVAWPVVTPERSYTVRLMFDALVLERGLRRVECDGMRLHLRPRSDSVTAIVPRSCLGLPAWVRTGSGSSAVVDGVQYVDDARRDNAFDMFEIELGKRVRVG